MKDDHSHETTNKIDRILPQKAWISLHEACSLKGLNYKTACNRVYLQPNRGVAEGFIGGRKSFTRETISNWLSLSDEEIMGVTHGK